MKVIVSVILLSLGSLFLFPSCSVSASAKGKGDITAKEWILVSVKSKDGLSNLTPSNDSYPTLLISEGRASGSAGCNRFMGSVTVDGNSLKFDKMATTMMLCQDGMDLEEAVLNIFGQANSYTVEKGNLLLKKDAEVLAVFKSNKIK